MRAGTRATWLLLSVLLLGCGEPHPLGPDPSEPVSGRLVLPPTFTNGTPYTSSTPFTNSTPAPALQALSEIALPRQTVLAIDPVTGRTVSGVRTQADGRFAFTVPSGYASLVLQVIVRDSAGQIRGLVASVIHPDVPRDRALTPGSTIVPLAGALATEEAAGMTYGAGFAGVARPHLARVLARLDDATTARAAATFDDALGTSPDANAVMRAVSSDAIQVAAQVSATPSEDPAVVGDRLNATLGHALPAPDPTPSVTPAPSASAPVEPPSDWIGHGPAVPAPYLPYPTGRGQKKTDMRE